MDDNWGLPLFQETSIINLTHDALRSKLQEKIEWQKFVSCTSRPNVMCGSWRIESQSWPDGYIKTWLWLGGDFHGKTTWGVQTLWLWLGGNFHGKPNHYGYSSWWMIGTYTATSRMIRRPTGPTIIHWSPHELSIGREFLPRSNDMYTVYLVFHLGCYWTPAKLRFENEITTYVSMVRPNLIRSNDCGEVCAKHRDKNTRLGYWDMQFAWLLPDWFGYGSIPIN